jgi:hypothetical protein
LKEIALTLSKEIIISDVLQEMHKIPYLLNWTADDIEKHISNDISTILNL